VVGGGPTGVEFAGELTDYLTDTCERFYPTLRPKVVLAHGGAALLPQFDMPLREAGLASLRNAGVDVRLNTRALEVGSDYVTLRSKEDREGGAGERVWKQQCGVVVWSGGNAPQPLTLRLASKLEQGDAGGAGGDGKGVLGPGGRLRVDGFCRVVGAPPGSLLAIGDAASFSVLREGEDSEVDAGCLLPEEAEAKGWLSCITEELPQTAQVAAQQGAFVARLLNRRYDLSAEVPVFRNPTAVEQVVLPLVRGLEARPFQFLNLGMLAYLGGGEALSQVQVGEERVLAQAGSVGFLLWRSVYLAKQVAFRNRVLVLFDWMKTSVFGRDATRL